MPTAKRTQCVISNIITLQFFLLTCAIFSAIDTMKINVNNIEQQTFFCSSTSIPKKREHTRPLDAWITNPTSERSLFHDLSPPLIVRKPTGVRKTMDEAHLEGHEADPRIPNFHPFNFYPGVGANSIHLSRTLSLCTRSTTQSPDKPMAVLAFRIRSCLFIS